MKKKLVGIIVIMLLMLNFFVGIVIAKDSFVHCNELEIICKVTENCRKDCSNDVIEVKTVGPGSFFINAAEIILIDGHFLTILLIELMLGSRNFHFLFPNISISVKDLAFSIKYTKNLNQLPILKRFFYKTTIVENGNVTFYTEKHTVIVTGFEGEFRLLRTKPIRLYPVHFWFAGTCEEAIVIT